MFADRRLKASELSPIYIGMQSNMTLGGPPAVLGGDQPFTRPGDQAGASSAGLLAALLLEPPQFLPAGITVR